MTKQAVALIGIGLIALSLVSAGVIAVSDTPAREESTAKVLNSRGREIGVLVNGQLRPSPTALESLKPTPCAPAIDGGPAWAFCRDGFYFSNAFEYRRYAAAKRGLANYTGPVIIVANGQQHQSFLKNGWLR